MRTAILSFLVWTAWGQEPGQIDAGGVAFQSTCSVCHGVDGAGSDRGPAILTFLRANADASIDSLIRDGRGAMPAHLMADARMVEMLAFLRALSARGPNAEPRKATVRLVGGKTLDGLVRSETAFDMQLLGADGKLHLLLREGNLYRERVTEPKTDWPLFVPRTS